MLHGQLKLPRELHAEVARFKRDDADQMCQFAVGASDRFFDERRIEQNRRSQLDSQGSFPMRDGLAQPVAKGAE